MMLDSAKKTSNQSSRMDPKSKLKKNTPTTDSQANKSEYRLACTIVPLK